MPWIIVLFVNHFLSHVLGKKAVMERVKFFLNTSVDWRTFCCEVPDEWFSNQQAIGRHGIDVEIDHTLIV